MIPINAVILIVVNQNSISPYFRTLNMLKAIGNTRKVVIQTAGLTCDFDNQKRIKLAPATSFAGKATRYLAVSLIDIRRAT